MSKTTIVVHGGRYGVHSTSDQTVLYAVTHESCSCPSFEFRHGPCKHMKKIEGWPAIDVVYAKPCAVCSLTIAGCTPLQLLSPCKHVIHECCYDLGAVVCPECGDPIRHKQKQITSFFKRS